MSAALNFPRVVGISTRRMPRKPMFDHEKKALAGPGAHDLMAPFQVVHVTHNPDEPRLVTLWWHLFWMLKHQYDSHPQGLSVLVHHAAVLTDHQRMLRDFMLVQRLLDARGFLLPLQRECLALLDVTLT